MCVYKPKRGKCIAMSAGNFPAISNKAKTKTASELLGNSNGLNILENLMRENFKYVGEGY